MFSQHWIFLILAHFMVYLAILVDLDHGRKISEHFLIFIIKYEQILRSTV